MDREVFAQAKIEDSLRTVATLSKNKEPKTSDISKCLNSINIQLDKIEEIKELLNSEISDDKIKSVVREVKKFFKMGRKIIINKEEYPFKQSLIKEFADCAQIGPKMVSEINKRLENLQQLYKNKSYNLIAPTEIQFQLLLNRQKELYDIAIKLGNDLKEKYSIK